MEVGQLQQKLLENRSLTEKNFYENYYRNKEWDETIKPHDLFESPISFEYKFVMQFFGDLKDKVIIDLGAGIGLSSIYFALQGARVIWIDISQEAFKIARDLSKKFNVEENIDFQLGDIKEILKKLSGLSIDFVFGSAILHHFDWEELPQSMYNLLKRGGGICIYRTS